MGLTPDQILAQTGNVALAERARAALAALAAAGIDPEKTPLDWAAVFHCGRSTADEYGLDKKTLRPVPGARNLMEEVANLILALAAVSDPDGTAPIVFVGDDAVLGKEGPRVTLANHVGWVDRNHPETRGSANFSAGMELLLQTIGEERNLPELAAVAELGRDDKPPVIKMKPYVAVIVAEGDPDNPDRVRDLFRLTEETGVHWVLAYVSNQRVGLEVYLDIAGPFSHVHLAPFAKGMKDVADGQAFELLVAGLHGWLQSNRSVRA